MKKFFKAIGLVLFLLTVAVTVSMLAVYSKSNTRFAQKFDLPLRPLSAQRSPKDVEEGKRLYISRGCPECHGEDLGGKTFINDPAVGVFSGANLTSGKGGIAGIRSDAILARAIRNGVGHDGLGLKLMPAEDYQKMTDADTAKLIGYLRSVQPVNRSLSPITVGPIARILFLAGKFPNLLAAAQIDHAVLPAAELQPKVTHEFGEYVAATCTGCHGANFAGGPIPGAPPEWPPAKDIRKEALAGWTETSFIRAIRTGKTPAGETMRFPMPWQSLGRLTDTELKALWLYIRSK